MWTPCPSPCLQPALTLGLWRSGWSLMPCIGREFKHPTGHLGTGSCFLTAGLRRLWPCCLPLPGFPQAAYLWTLMGAGVHSNPYISRCPGPNSVILSLSAVGSASWSLSPNLCLSSSQWASYGELHLHLGRVGWTPGWATLTCLVPI